MPAATIAPPPPCPRPNHPSPVWGSSSYECSVAAPQGTGLNEIVRVHVFSCMSICIDQRSARGEEGLQWKHHCRQHATPQLQGRAVIKEERKKKAPGIWVCGWQLTDGGWLVRRKEQAGVPPPPRNVAGGT